MNSQRLHSGAGVAGAVLSFSASLLVFSSLPKADGPVEAYVDFVIDKRPQILAGLVVFCIAVGLLVWWAATLRSQLADAGGGPLADLVLAGAVLAFGSGFAGFTPLAAVAWRGPGTVDANVVRLLVDMLALLFTVLSAVPFFLFILAASLAMRRTGLFAPWLVWFGVASAAVNGVFVFALFSRDGVLSPYSAIGVMAAVMLFGWIAVTSAAMVHAGTSGSSA